MGLVAEGVRLVLRDEVVFAALRPRVLTLPVVHDARAALVLVRVREVVRHAHVVTHLVSYYLEKRRKKTFFVNRKRLQLTRSARVCLYS